ncbi:hypothetical protein FKE98_08455 [Corynebacterium aurimucosum]|uniref:Rep family protein n=1 Tax=Corynebacterium guaraldiae TaxID=3051103 RepID=UPI0012B6DCC6|nr:Rep family protein [Corynebacterium guaraldiae]MTE10440.1 hypothetical protein [Corynebacterium guaraldiae]
MLNRPEGDETHTPVALPEQPTEFAKLHENLQMLARVGTENCPYKTDWAYADEKDMEGREFFVTQNTHYNGVEIFSVEQIQRVCDMKGMTEWSYIVHDKDTYTNGDLKAEHIHGAFKRKNVATVGQVARWLGVPPQQVELKRGGAYPYLVEYLTHEHPDQQDKGKHLYDRSEVVTSDPAVWDKVDQLKEKRKKSKVSLIDIFEAVSNGEMTPDDVRRDYRHLYVRPNMISHLKKLRADYLRHRPVPPRVATLHITGKAGTGKDAIGLAVSHTLEMPAFKTNSDGVVFEGYDGQRCVIWGDCRAASLIRALGHPGAVYNVFSPYPQKEDLPEVNIKYSSAPLAPALNIVTSEVASDEFLSALAGEYEDRSGRKHKAEGKEQAYRRFPIIIEVEKGQYTIRLNKGYFHGTRDYFEYITLGTFSQDLEGLLRRANNIADPEERAATIKRVEAQTVAPIVEIIKQILDGDPNAPAENAEALLADFAHVGTPVAAQTSRINPPPMNFAVADTQQSEYFSRTDFLCTAVRANPAAPPRAWLFDGTENGQQHRILQVQNLDGSYTNYVASMTYDIIGPATRTTGALDASPASVHTAVGNDVLIAGEPANSEKLCVTSQGKTYIWCKPGTDDKDRKNLEVRVSANTRNVIRVVSENNDSFPAGTTQRLQRYSAVLVDSATHISLEQKVLTADEAVAVINRGTWATAAVSDDELQQIFSAITAGGAER